VLDELKAQETAKLEEKEEKERKKLEREEKRKQKQMEVEKKRNAKKKEKEQPRTRQWSRPRLAKGRKLEEILQDMTIDSDHENSQSDEDEDRAICPKCGLIYPDDGFWICFDGCNDWFDIRCTK